VKDNTLTIKNKRLPGIPWLFLTLMAVLLSASVCFAFIPRTWAAQVTMEVYQQQGHKAFGQETKLDIFNNPKNGGQKIIAPNSHGSYSFAVHNNSNSGSLPYSLTLEAVNPDNIPIFVSLEKNGKEISSGKLLTELRIPDKPLSGNKTDMYTLNWRWITETDEVDTNIGNDGTQTYQLNIKATGSLNETDANSDNNGGKKGISPLTGYLSNPYIWIVLMIVSSLTILLSLWFLIFSKRRKDQDEKNQTDSKDR